MNDDRGPVFKRSKWGTQRYTYNPRNPLGLALIIIALLSTGTMMLLMMNRAGPFARDPVPTQSPSPYDNFLPPLPPLPSTGTPKS